METKFQQVVKKKQLTNKAISEATNEDKGNVSKFIHNKATPSEAFLVRFCKAFALDYNKEFATQTPLIPLYEDVASIGGLQQESNSQSNHTVTYIHPGDWFPGATAAIRHYDDSMAEYPSGCILALKEVKDLEDGLIWGKIYVVEYGLDWNRVTKRLQKNENKIMAYSTNNERHADNTLIHQPFELKGLHRAFLVLGCVIKSHSSNIIEVV